MINAEELRMGNYTLHKSGVRILPEKVTFHHFELMAKGMSKDFFPVSLKDEVLQKCGLVENKKYYLLPEAREFVLTLPVPGSGKNEICVYINSNKESYGRAAINNLVMSNNFYYLHQLQNLYYALVGKELEVMI